MIVIQCPYSGNCETNFNLNIDKIEVPDICLICGFNIETNMENLFNSSTQNMDLLEMQSCVNNLI